MLRRVLAATALLCPFVAEAAAPPLVPVTGYLVDDAGAPVDGAVDMHLKLYTDASTTSALWTEDQTVDVDQGQFTVYLGDAAALDLATFKANGTLFLGVAIDTGAEMTPRLQVATSPFAGYAQYCDDADTVGGIDPADLVQAGDPLTWNDLTGVPTGLQDGDQDTTYTAGTGLTLTGTSFAIAPSVYDSVSELTTDLDAVYFPNISCLDEEVLMADATGGWNCVGVNALPLDEGVIDSMVANNGYAADSALTATNSAVTALTARVTTAETNITGLSGLAWNPPLIAFDTHSTANVAVSLVNNGTTSATMNLATTLTVPTGFTRVSDTCGASLAAKAACTVTFAITTSGTDGVRSGNATLGAASLALSGTYASKLSCKWHKSQGAATSGLYYIDPDGAGGFPAFQAYCDQTTDGGGWTLVSVINANSEQHGLPGQVGALPINVTDAGPKKLDDRIIRLLVTQGPPDNGTAPIRASYRFTCDNVKHFFPPTCQWRATKGLPTNADPCVTSYTDEGAQTVQNNVACNWGSGALGSHCISGSPAAHTYCSHCDYADGAVTGGVYLPGGIDLQHQRQGCGHDATGYSKAGTLYVR